MKSSPFLYYLTRQVLGDGSGYCPLVLVGRLKNLLLLFYEHVVFGGEKDGAVR